MAEPARKLDQTQPFLREVTKSSSSVQQNQFALPARPDTNFVLQVVYFLQRNPQDIIRINGTAFSRKDVVKWLTTIDSRVAQYIIEAGIDAENEQLLLETIDAAYTEIHLSPPEFDENSNMVNPEVLREFVEQRQKCLDQLRIASEVSNNSNLVVNASNLSLKQQLDIIAQYRTNHIEPLKQEIRNELIQSRFDFTDPVTSNIIERAIDNVAEKAVLTSAESIYSGKLSPQQSAQLSIRRSLLEDPVGRVINTRGVGAVISSYSRSLSQSTTQPSTSKPIATTRSVRNTFIGSGLNPQQVEEAVIKVNSYGKSLPLSQAITKAGQEVGGAPFKQNLANETARNLLSRAVASKTIPLTIVNTYQKLGLTPTQAVEAAGVFGSYQKTEAAEKAFQIAGSQIAGKGFEQQYREKINSSLVEEINRATTSSPTSQIPETKIIAFPGQADRKTVSTPVPTQEEIIKTYQEVGLTPDEAKAASDKFSKNISAKTPEIAFIEAGKEIKGEGFSEQLTNKVLQDTAAQEKTVETTSGTQLVAATRQYIAAKQESAPKIDTVVNIFQKGGLSREEAVKAAQKFDTYSQTETSEQAFYKAGREVSGKTFDKQFEKNITERFGKGEIDQNYITSTFSTLDNYKQNSGLRIFTPQGELRINKISVNGQELSVEQIQNDLNQIRTQQGLPLFSQRDIEKAVLGKDFISTLAQQEQTILASNKIIPIESVRNLNLSYEQTIAVIDEVNFTLKGSPYEDIFSQINYIESQQPLGISFNEFYGEGGQSYNPGSLDNLYGNSVDFNISPPGGGYLAEHGLGSVKTKFLSGIESWVNGNIGKGGFTGFAAGGVGKLFGFAAPDGGTELLTKVGGEKIAALAPVLGQALWLKNNWKKIGAGIMTGLGGLAYFATKGAVALGGALTGGVAGAFAGAKIGIAIGTAVGGPIGAFVGGVVGGVLGFIGGVFAGGFLGWLLSDVIMSGIEKAKAFLTGEAAAAGDALGSTSAATSGIIAEAGGGAAITAQNAIYITLAATTAGGYFIMSTLSSAFSLPPFDKLTEYYENLPYASRSCKDSQGNPLEIPEGFANGFPLVKGRITNGVGHTGYAISANSIDIGMRDLDVDERNQPIYATHDGVVVFAGWDTGYGHHVRVQGNIDGKTFETFYAHMPEIISGMVVGKTIKRGELLGQVNNSGKSTGDHLHYEIRGDKYFPGLSIACTLPVPEEVQNAINNNCRPMETCLNFHIEKN
jgi:murein DD-endopeptidase MepM/ murein hydrolase activator NlpD